MAWGAAPPPVRLSCGQCVCPGSRAIPTGCWAIPTWAVCAQVDRGPTPRKAISETSQGEHDHRMSCERRCPARAPCPALLDLMLVRRGREYEPEAGQLPWGSLRHRHRCRSGHQPLLCEARPGNFTPTRHAGPEGSDTRIDTHGDQIVSDLPSTAIIHRCRPGVALAWGPTKYMDYALVGTSFPVDCLSGSGQTRITGPARRRRVGHELHRDGRAGLERSGHGDIERGRRLQRADRWGRSRSS